MRKIRENLRAYGGLACMCTLTAPGEGRTSVGSGAMLPSARRALRRPAKGMQSREGRGGRVERVFAGLVE